MWNFKFFIFEKEFHECYVSSTIKGDLCLNVHNKSVEKAKSAAFADVSDIQKRTIWSLFMPKLPSQMKSCNHIVLLPVIYDYFSNYKTVVITLYVEL